MEKIEIILILYIEFSAFVFLKLDYLLIIKCFLITKRFFEKNTAKVKFSQKIFKFSNEIQITLKMKYNKSVHMVYGITSVQVTNRCNNKY